MKRVATVLDLPVTTYINILAQIEELIKYHKYVWRVCL